MKSPLNQASENQDQEANDFSLIAKQAFGEYAQGDMIENSDEVLRILASEQSVYVMRQAKPAK